MSSTHYQVFGHLNEALFSAEEAAEYLEIPLPALHHQVESKRLAPTEIIGHIKLFGTADLRLLKQKLKNSGE